MNKFLSLIFVPFLILSFSVSVCAVEYNSPEYWAETERYKFKINDECGLKNTAYSYAEDKSGRNFYFMFCTEDINYSKANAVNFSIYFEIYSYAIDRKDSFSIHLSDDDVSYSGENGVCSVDASWGHHRGVVVGYFRFYGFSEKVMTEPVTVKTFLKSISFAASGMPDDNVLVFNKSGSASHNSEGSTKAPDKTTENKTNTTKKKIYSSDTEPYSGIKRKNSSGSSGGRKYSSPSSDTAESKSYTNPNANTIKDGSTDDTIVLSKNKVIAAAVSAAIAGTAAAMIISVVIKNKKKTSAGIDISDNNKKQ